MKITIETINDELCTVIWYNKGIEPDIKYADVKLLDGSWIFRIRRPTARGCKIKHIATALPALPRHPKPEDAPLLYRYMAEGVEPILVSNHPVLKGRELFWEKYLREGWEDSQHNGEITHATHNGERVEVAIEGGE